MITRDGQKWNGSILPLIKVLNILKKVYDPCLKTLFIGKKIVYLPTCHSTNDTATELVRKENLAEGTVVITNAQTAGKGQRSARWLTSPGENFTFSLVLRPTFLAASEQFLLSQAIALGVVRFVAGFANQAQIKWPNDLYVNQMKLGGILIENAWQGSRISHAIVGIGLNINQVRFGNEPLVRGVNSSLRATSLRLVTGKAFVLNDLLPDLLLSLEHSYLRLRAGYYEQIRSDYHLALLGFGENRLFRADGDIFEGVVEGVTFAGKLCIQKKDDLYKEYDIREVEWLWPDSYSNPEMP